MAIENKQMLHIVMFPWLAFGHLLPFLNLAKYLATKGHRISFLSTSRNLQRLPIIPNDLLPQLSLIPIPLHQVPGLPPNAEATTDLPSADTPILREAYHGMTESVEQFLRNASHVDWIVHDMNPFIGRIADALGIKKAFFITTSARTISVIAPMSYIEELESERGSRPTPNQDILSRIREDRKCVSDIDEVSELTAASIKNTDVVIMRSSLEYEPEALELQKMLYKKPVVAAGLMPVFQRDDNDQEKNTWQVISGWFDAHKERSVIYIALGSEVSPTQDQITQLALGLEDSNLPFFWALRKTTTGCSVDLPDEFEERTKDRGIVWTKWAPQTKILAHDSVGAFISHCGCSSVIEGIQYGKPFLMLPFQSDQWLNTKILEEKKFGIKIPRGENDGSISKSSVADCLKLVMLDEAGNLYREEVGKMSRIVTDKELQQKYFDEMEAYLRNYEHDHSENSQQTEVA